MICFATGNIEKAEEAFELADKVDELEGK